PRSALTQSRRNGVDIGQPLTDIYAISRFSAEVDGGELFELLQAVRGVDLTDRAGARAHHQRLGGGPGLRVLHALEQLTVGDPGRCEEAVVAGHQAVGVEHLVEVVTGSQRRVALLVVSGPEAALDDA